jgi:ABC-type lipoprotein release transport system permease subunit
MILFIKMAWRNIFRNKRRTYISGIAIGIGLASLIFMDATMIGMKNNMIRAATASFLGQGQIHHQNYRDAQQIELTVQNLQSVRDSLDGEKIIAHYTLRVFSLGTITSATDLQYISIVGINPATEKYLSQIDEAMINGGYLNDSLPQEIIIGKKLAEILNVGIGDRVVVTCAQAYTGELTQELFRISGIFYFNIPDMDRAMAFIHLAKAQQILALRGGVHEIALQFKHTKEGSDTNLPFWKKYSTGGNEAVSWTKLLPQLNAVLQLSDFSVYLIALILFGVVALGIINTLFMSIHERMFEFGVLRAVGTRAFSVARLVVLEAGALAIISIILGTILGFCITYSLSKIGIDYTGIEFVGVTIRELLYPVLTLNQYLIYPFVVFIFTLVISLYPALHAARISVVKALRKSL